MSDLQIVEITDEMWLTQAGDCYSSGGYSFPHGLRSERGELDVSLIIGKLSVSEACEVRDIGEANPRPRKHAARHAQVSRLKQLNFRIVSTPTDVNPQHASAYWDDGPWDARIAERFCRAFQTPIPQTGQST
ncbi:hypothetical protein [Streptomyces sp. SGAir0957]